MARPSGNWHRPLEQVLAANVPVLEIGATQWGKPARTEFVVTDNEIALQGRTTGKLVLITGTGDHKGVPPYCRTRDVETVSSCDINAAAETRIRKLGEA